jgi:hypothetical protein
MTFGESVGRTDGVVIVMWIDQKHYRFVHSKEKASDLSTTIPADVTAADGCVIADLHRLASAAHRGGPVDVDAMACQRSACGRGHQKSKSLDWAGQDPLRARGPTH